MARETGCCRAAAAHCDPDRRRALAYRGSPSSCWPHPVTGIPQIFGVQQFKPEVPIPATLWDSLTVPARSARPARHNAARSATWPGFRCSPQAVTPLRRTLTPGSQITGGGGLSTSGRRGGVSVPHALMRSLCLTTAVDAPTIPTDCPRTGHSFHPGETTGSGGVSYQEADLPPKRGLQQQAGAQASARSAHQEAIRHLTSWDALGSQTRLADPA